MGEATTVHEDSQERLSLLELLDRVLNKGVVLSGDLVISVADVDSDLPPAARAADLGRDGAGVGRTGEATGAHPTGDRSET